jgi:ubiquinone/menaquinone biosynthesis C-methylase UbiE
MAEDVCPVWVGHLLASPLRRLLQDPRKILAPYLREGMIALDVGCATGFFSLPMAVLVGPSGKVVCADLQEGMLKALERRARKSGVADRLEAIHSSPDTLGLGGWQGRIDFALAFAVAHEVPDRARLFAEIHAAIRTGGRLLLAEPRGHVKPPDFERTLATAVGAGLTLVETPRIRGSHGAVLRKPAAAGER